MVLLGVNSTVSAHALMVSKEKNKGRAKVFSRGNVDVTPKIRLVTDLHLHEARKEKFVFFMIF